MDAFLPVVAPASIEGIRNLHYPSPEDFLFAMADVLGEEYRAITAAGFIVQIDDAMLPLRRALAFRDKSLADYKRWAEVRIEALNRALKGVPPERARYHICFGSQNAPHTSDPELIARRLENFASLVGRENVLAGTDCGFSQGWNSARVHAQVQWAKLEALVQGARLASQRLWRR